MLRGLRPRAPDLDPHRPWTVRPPREGTTMPTEGHLVDVAVIGGGQAGLATGYFLRRTKADFVILDENDRPGGAWPEYWDSLRPFSPAEHSMLPGWWMPEEKGQEYPSARHVAWYLTEYERRYALPVHRPVRVRRVESAGDRLRLVTDGDTWSARRVISAKIGRAHV